MPVAMGYLIILLVVYFLCVNGKNRVTFGTEPGAKKFLTILIEEYGKCKWKESRYSD